MEHGACNVIYLDRRANEEYVRRDQAASSLAARASADTQSLNYFTPSKPTNAEVRENVNAILAFFNEGESSYWFPILANSGTDSFVLVNVCNSGSSCLSKISELHRPDGDCNPILVLIDMPFEDEERMKRLSREPRTPSPTSTRKSAPATAEPNEPEDIYGMHLLLHLASEIQQRTYSKLVVPVAVLSGFDQDISTNTLSPIPRSSSPPPLTDTVRLAKYLDAGAVDVYTSPLSPAHLHGLAVHAYRVYREVTKEESSFLMSKRNRKLSWVGVEEQKPYAYLREAMVSGLMSKICNPETVVETHNPL
jgi:CheY-like chemotaxis protein